jgi:hypothetical protein
MLRTFSNEDASANAIAGPPQKHKIGAAHRTAALQNIMVVKLGLHLAQTRAV